MQIDLENMIAITILTILVLIVLSPVIVYRITKPKKTKVSFKSIEQMDREAKADVGLFLLEKTSMTEGGIRLLNESQK